MARNKGYPQRIVFGDHRQHTHDTECYFFIKLEMMQVPIIGVGGGGCRLHHFAVIKGDQVTLTGLRSVTLERACRQSQILKHCVRVVHDVTNIGLPGMHFLE